MTDETNGWIFSDEGHKWMDHYRGPEILSNYQRTRTFTNDQPRYGWEYGLFGFKHADEGGNEYVCLASLPEFKYAIN